MILHHTSESHTILWELVWNVSKHVEYHLSKINIKGISYNKELTRLISIVSKPIKIVVVVVVFVVVIFVQKR